MICICLFFLYSPLSSLLSESGEERLPFYGLTSSLLWTSEGDEFLWTSIVVKTSVKNTLHTAKFDKWKKATWGSKKDRVRTIIYHLKPMISNSQTTLNRSCLLIGLLRGQSVFF